MSLISGKDGTLTSDGIEVAELTDWKLRKTGGAKAYTANDTGGAAKRVSGAKDCSGEFEVKVAQGRQMPVEEGDAVTLRLHVDDSGANYFQVPAVIDAVRVSVDVDQGKIVACRVGFSGNGPVTAYGILEVADSGSSGS